MSFWLWRIWISMARLARRKACSTLTRSGWSVKTRAPSRMRSSARSRRWMIGAVAPW